MAGHRSFDELRSAMSPVAQAAADGRALALRADVLLSELRARSAAAPAAAEDMPVAALRSWVRSLGGELAIAVALPDGRRVQVSGSIG